GGRDAEVIASGSPTRAGALYSITRKGTCPELDVIAIHGYFDRSETSKWETVLKPAMKRAKDAGKLLLVEEWFSRYKSLDYNGVGEKTADLRIQALAMQKMGVPSVYWDAMRSPEGTLCNNGNWASEGDDISVDGPWWKVMADIVAWVGDRNIAQPPWGQYLKLLSRPVETKVPIPKAWEASPYWQERMPVSDDDDQLDHPTDPPLPPPPPTPTSPPPPPPPPPSTTTTPPPETPTIPVPAKCGNKWCSGQDDCVGGRCVPCTWGCFSWACSATQPCKPDASCQDGFCWAQSSDGGNTTTKKPTPTPKPPTPPTGGYCDAGRPCTGEQDCIDNKCRPCTWGCLTWNCNKDHPCRPGAWCKNGVCAKS
ncbi:hypothetical protein BDZ88DRAFT_442774, partial [Geranomyces variabilis]